MLSCGEQEVKCSASVAARFNNRIVTASNAAASIIFQGRLTPHLRAAAGLCAVTRSVRRVGGRRVM